MEKRDFGPTTLVPFDASDSMAVGFKILEEIAWACNSLTNKNKWHKAQTDADRLLVMHQIREDGERAAKRFVKDYAPSGFPYQSIINHIDAIPSGAPNLIGLDESLMFRANINGANYERLVAAICAKDL